MVIEPIDLTEPIHDDSQERVAGDAPTALTGETTVLDQTVHHCPEAEMTGGKSTSIRSELETPGGFGRQDGLCEGSRLAPTVPADASKTGESHDFPYFDFYPTGYLY